MKKDLQIKIVKNTSDYINNVFDNNELIKRFNMLLDEQLDENSKKIVIELKKKIEYEIQHNYENSKEDQAINDKKIQEFTNVLNNEKFPNEAVERINEIIDSVKKEKTTLHNNISNLLASCYLYIESVKNMNAAEIMELVTSYIGGVMPNISDEFLEQVIDEAIKTGIPEKAWRIAFNYDERLKDKTKLEDFIISTNNAYQIAEMSNAGFIGIHINKLVDAIIATNNIKEMSYFIISSRNDVLDNINKTKIEEAIKRLNGWQTYQNYKKNPHF